jgi:FkbH-like protein
MKIFLFFDYNTHLIEVLLRRRFSQSIRSLNSEVHSHAAASLMHQATKVEDFDFIIVHLCISNFVDTESFRSASEISHEMQCSIKLLASRVTELCQKNKNVIFVKPRLPNISFESLSLSTRERASLRLLSDRFSVAFRDLTREITNLAYAIPDEIGYSTHSDCAIADPFGPTGARSLLSTLEPLLSPYENRRFKVICIDLDNTLWRGEIGELELNEIELGGITPRGRGYKMVQQALLKLKNSGILLAVVSKNDRDVVSYVLKTHPEMVLCEEDFVKIYADWGPKSESIANLSKELGIHISDFLYLDDSAQEIAEVRYRFPEISVLEFSGNPMILLEKLLCEQRLRYQNITEEDGLRTAFYRSNSNRNVAIENSPSCEPIHKILEVRVSVADVGSEFSRVLQLLNKTNQFNAVSMRYTEHDLQKLRIMSDSSIYAFRARDKFGDYGLVSVVVTRERQGLLQLCDFVLSCRALGKGIEDAVLKKALSKSSAEHVIVSFHETERNHLIREYYEKYRLLDHNHAPIQRRIDEIVAEVSESAAYLEE